MLQASNDAKLTTDYLTKYLKHYKAIFHLQLAFIESIYNHENQISEHINRFYIASKSANT